MILLADSEGPDKSARMRRVIWDMPEPGEDTARQNSNGTTS